MMPAEAYSPSPWVNIGFIVILFAVMYLLVIRPQMKRQKEQRQMLSALQKGDEVLTIGGIAGTISSISDTFVILSVSDSVDLHVQKSAVSSLLPKGTLKSAE